MALYMVMMADEDDMDRFIMPLSEDLNYIAKVAREIGTYIFVFEDRTQHNAMLQTLDLYHKKMGDTDKGAFYFSGPNPGLEKDKPAGMSMAEYVYGRVSQFARYHGVKVINPAHV